jgi:hypothetical protein
VSTFYLIGNALRIVAKPVLLVARTDVAAVYCNKYMLDHRVLECHKGLQSAKINVKCNDYYLFSWALQPSAGCCLFVSRDFVITHNDAPRLVGLL